MVASAQPWLVLELCWPKMFRVEVFILGFRYFTGETLLISPKEGSGTLTPDDNSRRRATAKVSRGPIAQA